MKIGFSNFTILTMRREPIAGAKAQVKDQPPLTAAKEADDPFTKRLKKQQEAFEALASLPSPKQAAIDNAAQKVGFLKQRLETLKAMMQFASPEQLKSMASELKSIAKELGVATRQLSNSGGGSAAPTVMPTVTASQSASQAAPTPSEGADEGAGEGERAEQDAASAEQQAQSADATMAALEAGIADEDDEEDNGDKDSHDQPGTSPPSEDAHAQASSATTPQAYNNDHDRRLEGSKSALRGVLTDAKKAFEEAASELKLRLEEEDKEARRDLEKAEETMEKVGNTLAGATRDALYSSLGQMLPGAAVETGNASVAINIEV